MEFNKINNDEFYDEKLYSLSDILYYNRTPLYTPQINNISMINFNIYQLESIDLSNNLIKSNTSHEILNNQIGWNLNIIYIDAKALKSIENLENNRIIRQIEGYTFYKALFIVVKSELDFVDCDLQLRFSKKNFILNLFYSNQIETFLFHCQNKII